MSDKVKGRTMLVTGVDLGDGKPATVWMRMGRSGLTVRRFYGRVAHRLTLQEAAELVARRAQLPIEKMLDAGVGDGDLQAKGSTVVGRNGPHRRRPRRKARGKARTPRATKH
jgi:hypothetical protein